MNYCHAPLASRSRYADVAGHRCWRPEGHAGRCDEYPYLVHLREVAPRLAEKIKRDATNTTGAAWIGQMAGPNRILRWAMTLSDSELITRGLDLTGLSPIVQAKLREKAASYEECIGVAQALTHAAYEMVDAPEPPREVRAYLEDVLGPIVVDSAVCIICLAPLSFELFARARRGAAELDMAHKDPRRHTSENVGFAHHRCNVAQGDMTVEEFYDWIEAIVRRARRR